MTAVWRAFFASSLVLLALLALSVPTVEPGSAAAVVSFLSVGMLGTMLVGSAAFIYYDWDPFEALLKSNP
ncbi:hypothetical protein [Haloarchaeobius sp. TZWWS8]|uniref:hypothetical protein n=1 Tax=Haloarchaeobius sp. TZWWS8 TaxID=3446121 RepID=UPI003EBD14E4